MGYKDLQQHIRLGPEQLANKLRSSSSSLGLSIPKSCQDISRVIHSSSPNKNKGCMPHGCPMGRLVVMACALHAWKDPNAPTLQGRSALRQNPHAQQGHHARLASTGTAVAARQTELPLPGHCQHSTPRSAVPQSGHMLLLPPLATRQTVEPRQARQASQLRLACLSCCPPQVCCGFTRLENFKRC